MSQCHFAYRNSHVDWPRLVFMIEMHLIVDKDLGPNAKENTRSLHYKDNPINAV